MPPRGTGPSPRSRMASRGRAGSRTCGPRRRAPRGAGSARAAAPRTRRASRRGSRREARAAGVAASRSGTTTRAARGGAPRTSSSRRARESAARPGGRGQPEAPDQERGHDRVVRVRVRDVLREGIRRPRERERRREPRAAEAEADEPEPDERRSVAESEVECAAGESSHLPAPAEDGVAGQVREVGDRAVGVAARVRRLAAAVRLDPLADLAFRVGRPARLADPPRPACGRTAPGRSTIRCAPTTPA